MHQTNDKKSHPEWPEFNIIHHGAVNGVTGSCHELSSHNQSILVDCGLFQGAEVSGSGRSTADLLQIDFPVEPVKALIVTHVHIDHVGRIPYLLAAGFKGPIYCSEPSAVLLPLVLEDALKIGFTRNKNLINRFLKQIEKQLVPLPYKQWFEIPEISGDITAKIQLQKAGHILGSAYVEVELSKPEIISEQKAAREKVRITFSGDLGPPFTPLLSSPVSPEQSDILVIESTYGDKEHASRQDRVNKLRRVIEKAVENRGVVLIPAFSIGRTQELLYELEQIIYESTEDSEWRKIEVIVDSPLAAKFTEAYRQLKPFWDKEATQKLHKGRHPLSFESLLTIDDHKTHLNTVKYLQKTARPTIVLAASGMCTGGRVVNYLKALISDPRHDILFVGYQAKGTAGRVIQKYGSGGYVELDGKRYDINMGVYTISGYSAHADQKNLLEFVNQMKQKPEQIRIVHGDEYAKEAFQNMLQNEYPDMDIVIPTE